MEVQPVLIFKYSIL